MASTTCYLRNGCGSRRRAVSTVIYLIQSTREEIQKLRRAFRQIYSRSLVLDGRDTPRPVLRAGDGEARTNFVARCPGWNAIWRNRVFFRGLDHFRLNGVGLS